MAFETERTTHETSKTPADEVTAGSGPPERESPARESLSWIRALASQWEDDRSSPVASLERPSE